MSARGTQYWLLHLPDDGLAPIVIADEKVSNIGYTGAKNRLPESRLR